ncbi:MAG: selenide, water dikinase SelD, partial [Anaerolineae bacterium]|nr:selenide, water dikinase SelD [Anaerolineae bacterium]
LQLNRSASRAARAAGVRAATDITGFSLLGHAAEMANASGVQLHLYLERIPLLEGTRQYAEEWLFPGGAHSNKEFFAPQVRFAGRISEEEQMMLFTPETSGGLLLAVPAERVEEFLAACQSFGQPAWHIGAVESGAGIVVE